MVLPAVVILVGNKTDLAEDRVISEEEGQEYASRYACFTDYNQPVLRCSLSASHPATEHPQLLLCCRSGMLFVETSAKTAANTSELFEMIARKIAASHSNSALTQQSASPAKPQTDMT